MGNEFAGLELTGADVDWVFGVGIGFWLVDVDGAAFLAVVL